MRHLIFLLVSLFACAHALQAQQAVLLGPDLEPLAITLRSFSPQRVDAIDWQGNAKTFDTANIVRLTFGTLPQAWPQERTVKATRRDGQVVVGQLAASDDDESIRLKIAGDLAVDLSLDDLLSLAFEREASVEAVGEDDAVLLATGETLTGFVDSITAERLAFVVGDADKPIEIPLDRIKALAIANKPQAIEASKGLVRVLLADDSLLLLKETELDLARQVLVGVSTLVGEAGKLSLSMDKVVQIEPLVGPYELSPLSALTMKHDAGGEVFGVAMPPRVLSDGSIQLHAPTTISYELPKGASRLSLVAELSLADDLPASQRALAGCELLIYDGQNLIGQVTLSPDQPPATLNVPLTSTQLRIELKPGVNGPVLDRVRLTQAQVLVDHQ